MRHLDTLGSGVAPIVGARSVVCALLLVVLGAAVATATSGSIRLDADGSGIAIGIPTADPTVYTVSLIASGQSAALGDFRARAHHFTNVTTGAFSEGEVILEFVSGDKLFGTYVGSEAPTESPDAFTFAGTIKFTGGTGRLGGATGKATFDGGLQIIGVSAAGVVVETTTLHLHGRLDF